MATWYVNKGLAVLIAALKVMFPGITIYTIGDAKHSSRVSDHNPNSAGRVNAADFMIRGPFTKAIAEWLIAILIKTSRTKYVIYNRRIWNKEQGWHDYTGTDPHTDHVHLSVWDSANSDTSDWNLVKRNIKMLKLTGNWPLVKEGDSDTDYDGWNVIGRIQKLAGVKSDGVWGPATTKGLGYNAMTEARYRELFGFAH